MWPYQVSILFCFCSALWLVLLEVGCGGCDEGLEGREQGTLRLFWRNTYDLQMNNYCGKFLLPFLIVALNDGCINNRCGVVGSNIEMFQ